MNFQQFATTTFGTKLWLSLGRLSPRAGHALARNVARILHGRKGAHIYRVVYANQSVVMGEDATSEQIDARVGAVLQHAGRVAFDFVHAVARGEQAIVDSIEMGDDFWANIHAARATGRGVLICGGHMSAFNLGFLSFAITGDFPILTLSADMPAGGYQVVHDLLTRGAIENLPIDTGALRKAIQRLRNGGVSLIGVDWPVGATERIPFFGRPAQLQSGYIRLALSTNALLVPLVCRWTPERGYFATTKPALDLELTGDRELDIHHNTHRLLSIIEAWIRETPEQWAMWHRVWPDDAPDKSATAKGDSHD